MASVTSLFNIRYAFVGLVLVGHIAFWIHWFNRINATGLDRKAIKFLEKAIIGICFLLPVIAAYFDGNSVLQWLSYSSSIADDTRLNSLNPLHEPAWLLADLRGAWMSKLLAVVSIVYLVCQAPLWLAARKHLAAAKSHAKVIDCQTIDMKAELGADKVFVKPWVRYFGALPLNELHWIQSVTEQLAIVRLPQTLSGLRVGHLSDIHLTGYMASEYYHRAIECMVNQNPDVVVLSGDLIDYEHCLGQVQPLLEPLKPRYGCYFVLGNHDRRLPDVERLRSMITELGWFDLGKQSRSTEIRGEEVYFIGNERPWFNPKERCNDEKRTADYRKSAAFRIGVSHSPDQITWARKLDLNLLFCGHNHGGQVRLPILGPLVAPSYFGSRYASGWFYESPTWMRVSRGLSGTQPLRFRCMPEVSVTRLD